MTQGDWLVFLRRKSLEFCKWIKERERGGEKGKIRDQSVH